MGDFEVCIAHLIMPPGETHRFVPICAARQGGRIAGLEVPHRPRRTGGSDCGFGKIFRVPSGIPIVRFLMRYDTNSS